MCSPSWRLNFMIDSLYYHPTTVTSACVFGDASVFITLTKNFFCPRVEQKTALPALFSHFPTFLIDSNYSPFFHFPLWMLHKLHFSPYSTVCHFQACGAEAVSVYGKSCFGEGFEVKALKQSVYQRYCSTCRIHILPTRGQYLHVATCQFSHSCEAHLLRD